MNTRFLLPLLLLLSLSACSTTLPDYSVSFRNAETIRSSGDHLVPIKLQPFADTTTWAEKVKCSENFIIKLPTETLGDYLYDAIKQELVLAKLYDETSDHTLSATIVRADFETDVPIRFPLSTINGGWWNFSAIFTTTQGRSFQVSDRDAFRVRGKADISTQDDLCQAALDAFVPALQKFLNAVYNDPEFLLLIGAPVKIVESKPKEVVPTKKPSSIKGKKTDTEKMLDEILNR